MNSADKEEGQVSLSTEKLERAWLRQKAGYSGASTIKVGFIKGVGRRGGGGMTLVSLVTSKN